MSLLRIEALTVRHGGITALDNQTLDVAAGEIVMVTGPNGAGKSSLLSCVAGYVKPWQVARPSTLRRWVFPWCPRVAMCSAP